MLLFIMPWQPQRLLSLLFLKNLSLNSIIPIIKNYFTFRRSLFRFSICFGSKARLRLEHFIETARAAKTAAIHDVEDVSLRVT